MLQQGMQVESHIFSLHTPLKNLLHSTGMLRGVPMFFHI